MLLRRLAAGRRLRATRAGDQYFLEEGGETRRLTLAEACALLASPEAEGPGGGEDDLWGELARDARSRAEAPGPGPDPGFTSEPDPEWDAFLDSLRDRAVPFTPPPSIPEREEYEALLDHHQFKRIEGDRWARHSWRPRCWLVDAACQDLTPSEQYLHVGFHAHMAPHVMATVRPDGITLDYEGKTIAGILTDEGLAAALDELLPEMFPIRLTGEEPADEDPAEPAVPDRRGGEG